MRPFAGALRLAKKGSSCRTGAVTFLTSASDIGGLVVRKSAFILRWAFRSRQCFEPNAPGETKSQTIALSLNPVKHRTIARHFNLRSFNSDV